MRLKEQDARILHVLEAHGWLMSRAVAALTKDGGARLSLYRLFHAGFLEREQAPGYRQYRYRLKSQAVSRSLVVLRAV
jgi:hypothetical protein